MASNATKKGGTTAKSEPKLQKKKAPEKKVVKKTTVTNHAKGDDSDNQKLILILDPVLVINHASEMHKKLSSFLDRADDEIIIDASSVEMIDTAMIQLLFGLMIGLKSKNVEITWRSPSSEFVDRVRTLGLTEIFGIDCLAKG